MRSGGILSGQKTGGAPPPVVGLVYHFAADSLALSDDDLVSAWADQSPAGNNASAAGVQRPVFKSNIVNSLPVVRFDGATQWMDVGLKTLGESSLLLVFKIAPTTTNIFLGSDGNNQFFAVTGNVLYAYNGGSNPVSGDISAFLGAFAIWEMKRVGDDFTFKVNGIVIAGITLNTSDPIIVNMISGIGGGGNGIEGDLPEIMVYNEARSEGQMAVDRATLSAKYAIPVAFLPTNTVLPIITGGLASGGVLTTDNGTWLGIPASYTYRWFKCDAMGNNPVVIVGETGNTYTTAIGDIGSTIRASAIAINSYGSSSEAISDATGLITI